MHELTGLGFGIEQRVVDGTCRCSMLLRKPLLGEGARHIAALPPPVPLPPRHCTNADYTIRYWIWTPFGCVYVGSHCAAGMLWAKIGPVTFWVTHRWKHGHRTLLLAGKHHSPKLQRQWDEARKQCPGWEPIALTATEANATCTISADGRTRVYIVANQSRSQCVTIEATLLAPGETIEVAKVTMVLREQVGILEAKLKGILTNASDLAGAIDTYACLRGGRVGPAPLPSPSPRLPSAPLPLTPACPRPPPAAAAPPLRCAASTSPCPHPRHPSPLPTLA